jgi:hypothetical protein
MNSDKAAGFDMIIDIGLVGNSDVGKTCLIRKYKFQDGFEVPKSKISTLGIEN